MFMTGGGGGGGVGPDPCGNWEGSSGMGAYL